MNIAYTTKYIYSIHLQKGFFVRVYEYTKALKFEKML